MFQAICDHCGKIGISAFEWVVVSVKKCHEDRKEGHKVDISPIIKVVA